jgi:hypothetical protein
MAININIDKGVTHIPVTRDGESVGAISFNANSIEFAEGFYTLLKSFDGRMSEFEKKAIKLDGVTKVDEFGFPINTKEKLQLIKETCEYMREEIDKLFGENTCSVVFGDSNTLDMFSQFFEGVIPYFEKSRSLKIAKYTKGKPAKSTGLK